MDVIIKVDLDANVRFKDDQWAATALPFGLTVFGNSENAAHERLEQAVQFLITNYVKGAEDPVQKAREFLDFHGVRHTVQHQPTSGHTRTVRKEMELFLSAG